MATKPNTRLELEFINTFVVRPKRARYSSFVVSPRLREKFLATLHSFSDFNPRLKVTLPRRQSTSRGFLAELRRRNPAATCYLISTHADLDGTTLPLEAAINDVHGLHDGTIVVCTPTLAYYEGEWRYRFILDSQPLGGAR
jgi:hypothetical protein